MNLFIRPNCYGCVSTVSRRRGELPSNNTATKSQPWLTFAIPPHLLYRHLLMVSMYQNINPDWNKQLTSIQSSTGQCIRMHVMPPRNMTEATVRLYSPSNISTHSCKHLNNLPLTTGRPLTFLYPFSLHFHTHRHRPFARYSEHFISLDDHLRKIFARNYQLLGFI